jgi:hypothetical protein
MVSSTMAVLLMISLPENFGALQRSMEKESILRGFGDIAGKTAILIQITEVSAYDSDNIQLSINLLV